MLVSIIIPAYNEADGIEKYLAQVFAFLKNQAWDAEVLVVDDGSKDATKEAVLRFKKTLPSGLAEKLELLSLGKNRGKGQAVKTGMLAAKGNYCGFTDADGSTPVTEIAKALPLLEERFDVVIGTRVKRAQDTAVRAFWHRRIIGRLFRMILKPLVHITDYEGQTVQDTQCGFKWFRQKAAKEIFGYQTINGFAFDVEILHLANRLGYTIYEMPVNWVDEGHSSVNLFSDPIKMFLQVLTISFKHRGLKEKPHVLDAKK